ncbi:hypothetical protein GGR67_000686 [Xanthomonas arboricola]|nr:hypothetical protein [Xanthomonas euroxanthea]
MRMFRAAAQTGVHALANRGMRVIPPSWRDGSAHWQGQSRYCGGWSSTSATRRTRAAVSCLNRRVMDGRDGKTQRGVTARLAPARQPLQQLATGRLAESVVAGEPVERIGQRAQIVGQPGVATVAAAEDRCAFPKDSRVRHARGPVFLINLRPAPDCVRQCTSRIKERVAHSPHRVANACRHQMKRHRPRKEAPPRPVAMPCEAATEMQCIQCA